MRVVKAYKQCWLTPWYNRRQHTIFWMSRENKCKERRRGIFPKTLCGIFMQNNFNSDAIAALNIFLLSRLCRLSSVWKLHSLSVSHDWENSTSVTSHGIGQSTNRSRANAGRKCDRMENDRTQISKVIKYNWFDSQPVQWVYQLKQERKKRAWTRRRKHHSCRHQKTAQAWMNLKSIDGVFTEVWQLTTKRRQCTNFYIFEKFYVDAFAWCKQQSTVTVVSKFGGNCLSEKSAALVFRE